MNLTRRSLFGGAAAFIAAPAIVRVASLMPVKVVPPLHPPEFYAKWWAQKVLEAFRHESTVVVYLECTAADLGYSVGQRLLVAADGNERLPEPIIIPQIEFLKPT